MEEVWKKRGEGAVKLETSCIRQLVRVKGCNTQVNAADRMQMSGPDPPPLSSSVALRPSTAPGRMTCGGDGSGGHWRFYKNLSHKTSDLKSQPVHKIYFDILQFGTKSPCDII